MENKNEKTLQKILQIICLSFGICVIFFVTYNIIIRSHVVGEVDGNKLIYNGIVYIETFENLDIINGRCLGSVVFKNEDGTKHPIFSVKNHPEYIMLSFGWDQRLYKIKTHEA